MIDLLPAVELRVALEERLWSRSDVKDSSSGEQDPPDQPPAAGKQQQVRKG